MLNWTSNLKNRNLIIFYLLVILLLSSECREGPGKRREMFSDVGIGVDVDAGHLPLDVQEPLRVLLLHGLRGLAADFVRSLIKKIL